MAVDTTLISGAYKANAPTGVQGVAEISKVASDVSQTLNAYMLNEKAKSDKANEEFLTNIGNAKLDPTNSSKLIDATKADRELYINAKDPVEKQKILNRINSQASDLSIIEGTITDIQDEKVKLSNSFTNTEEGLALSRLLANPDSIEIKDGVPGITINGEFMDKDGINDYIKKNSMDTSFGEVMKAVDLKQGQARESQGDSYTFNRENVRNDIRMDIDQNANVRSLFEDNIYGNRNFKNDLIESLGNKTYSDLGVSQDMFNNADANSDSKLDEAEIDNLITSLKGNEPLLKDMLTDYYTDIIGQNYATKPEPTVEPTVAPADEITPAKPGLTDKQRAREIQKRRVEAGAPSMASSEDVAGDSQVDEQGVYVPQQTSDNNNNAPKQTSKGYNYDAVSALSVSASGGKANILENGNMITLNNVKTGNAFFPEVNITGVKAEGNNISVGTSMGVNQNFGKFVKRGGGYKWIADGKNMKIFNDNASESQKKAFSEFIQIVQKDPAYAEQLLSHIKSGSGDINAATLK